MLPCNPDYPNQEPGYRSQSGQSTRALTITNGVIARQSDRAKIMEAGKRLCQSFREQSDVKHVPPCHATTAVVPVSDQRGETEGQEEYHDPEERGVCLETWADMGRAPVESHTTFTTGVRDLAVRRAFVPIVIVSLARVVVW